ncbi:MAG: glycosyl hydrolase 53 family protein [Prolixibacteraceae bacterium]|nr:glycosyl hydrolase 53 family protein [Prolixibacteraceae bacterium]
MMLKSIIKTSLFLMVIFGMSSCSKNQEQPEAFMIGGDFSILKKMEDSGGVYKHEGRAVDALSLFAENGYNYGRVRLFHTPNMEGPVCNSLDYTIELSKKIKTSGMKLLLNFHYSDTWADPAHQIKPKAWENLTFDVLTDSVYQYSKAVIEAMDKAGVLPDMVQVGNEITPGFIWPDGQIWKDGTEDWQSFCTLLKAGIDGVKAAYGNRNIPIMIHIDRGGDQAATQKFFEKMVQYGIQFDLIGLSYYPWWHGTFDDLEKNLGWLSANYQQDIVIVETAYYANGYYPEPDEWVLDIQPFSPTEQGQFDFLIALDSIARQYPKVKGIFYWKPDGLKIPESNVWFIGRSLFDENGNALKGITAFKY